MKNFALFWLNIIFYPERIGVKIVYDVTLGADFIFPNLPNQIGEVENLVSSQYYYIATTLDNHYEQIMIRSLLKTIGLGMNSN